MLNQPVQTTNRVLIADDDPVILDVVKTLVESEGYEVVTAQDGLEAYRILLNDSDFRAIILDMQMPYIEGADLLRQMQTEKRLSRIPVLMMSSSVDLNMLSSGFGPGAMAFIPKPFQPSQMRNTLRLIALKDNLAARAPRPSVDTKPAHKAASNSIKVLLIEDNPGEAIVIEVALLKAAAKVPRFANVEFSRAGLLSAGIERLLADDVDVVLLDLSLPDSEGLQTLSSLIAQNAGVPIVVLTGTEDGATGIKALKLGARDYLVKGQVGGPEIIRAVSSCLQP
ncbi:MAG: response regulator [Acidobacteriota bacterium]